MEERPEGNYELNRPDIFEVSNHYFLLFFCLSCIFSSVFLQQIFVMLQQTKLGMSIAPTAGIILPIFLITRRFRGFRNQVKLRRPSVRLMLHVVLASLCAVVIVDNLYVISQLFLPPPSEYIEGLKAIRPDGPVSFLVTCVGLCIVVPIAEELVFRGMIQQVFAANMGGILALVLAGVFFGAIHLNAHLLLSMTFFGAFLGFLFYATRNLTYSILAHAVLNSIAFLQLSASTEEDLSVAPFYVRQLWYMGAAALLLAVLLWQIKKETPSSKEAPGNSEDG